MYNKRNKKIAVLGAGNGGQAMAGYLALEGYRVNLFNRSWSRIKPVSAKGGIQLEGVFEGFGSLQKVTCDIKEAVTDVDFILIVTPAVAHRELARKLVHCLQDGQIVVLNPGRTGGALEFNHILQTNNCQAEITIAETQTFLFASRVIGPARARIFGVKRQLPVAAFPGIKIKEVIENLISIFPQFYPEENVLQTSLDNIGAIFHPAPTLLNTARIESTGGKFYYYRDGITPSVARILELMDKERMAVAYKFDLQPTSACDWLKASYGCEGSNLYDLLQNNENYIGIEAPADMNSRYVLEDVPMSLVPLASFGSMVGVETPVINMIIDMADTIYDTDFRAKGRTIADLGLSGLAVSDILNYVNKGILEDDVIGKEVISLFKDKTPNYPSLLIADYYQAYEKEVE